MVRCESTLAGRDPVVRAIGLAAALAARWIAPGEMLLVATGLLTVGLLARYRRRAADA